MISRDSGPAGRFSVMTPDGIPVPLQVNIHSDAGARFQDGRVYILNRLNRDNIQVLNPQAAYLTELEFSLGSLSNPHDIVRVSENKAYVSLYAKNYLAIVNPTLGLVVGTIDLAGFADGDGIPEMSGMHLEDNRLYVAVQRLDRTSTLAVWPPADYSLLLEVDTGTDTVVAQHTLPHTNPAGRLRRVQFEGAPHLVMTLPGRLGLNFQPDGGVVAFNLNTRALRPGFLLRESTLNADILDVVIRDDTTGYAIIEYGDLSLALIRFDIPTGQLTRQLAFYPSTAGYVSGLLLLPDGRLYAADASFQEPGVLIYDTNRNDVRLTPTPISVGLRPQDLIHIE